MTRLSGDLITVDGRDALRFERRLAHGAERVWRAVTDPAEVAQWFVGPVEWGPTLGETAEVMGQTFTVTELEEHRLLAWTWGEESYRFELRPDGDATLFIFTHVFTAAFGPADQHAAGWETYLDRLRGLLAGVPLSAEEAHDPIVEYHEAYCLRFGSDPAVGRAMFASLGFRDLTVEGDTVRLQRRYLQPVGRLWRAFTDPAELAQWFPEAQELVVTEASEPTLIRATWWGEPLTIRFQEQGDGTLLAFEHTISDLPGAARTAAGWDRSFFALEALLAGNPVSREASLAQWPNVHERYAERLGCDPEIGRAAFAAAGERDGDDA